MEIYFLYLRNKHETTTHIKAYKNWQSAHYPHVAGEPTSYASAMTIFCTSFFYFLYIFLTYILYLFSLGNMLFY